MFSPDVAPVHTSAQLIFARDLYDRVTPGNWQGREHILADYEVQIVVAQAREKAGVDAGQARGGRALYILLGPTSNKFSRAVLWDSCFSDQFKRTWIEKFVALMAAAA